MLVGISVITMLVFGTVAGKDNRSNADRAYDVGATIACPQCVGQSVVQSDVAIAREIRAEIGQLVVAGYSDDQIRNRFAERYGEWVVLTPAAGGLSGLIWLIPVVGLVVGGGLLAVTLSRWRRASLNYTEVTAKERDLVAAARQKMRANHTAKAADAEAEQH